MDEQPLNRKEAIEALEYMRSENIAMGRNDLGLLAKRVALTLERNDKTMGQMLGAKGGNTPVKPGSRPRGRPRKIVDAMAGMEASMSPESIEASNRIFEKVKADLKD